jgi:SAM-dependent methyltransferase
LNKGLVIEAGSNDGYLSEQFLKRGNKVLGVDPSPYMADLAKQRNVPTIVVQGVNRLETKLDGIRKDLQAKNTQLPAGDIHVLPFSTGEEEYAYIAQEVKKLLNANVPPEEIALIAREHKQLIALLPYLDALHIPYAYMRKENVFDEKHVAELITLCRFLASVGASQFERDDLLPEILAFPFWGLSRLSIWNVAEYAKRENVSWLEAMRRSDDVEMHALGTFLIELGIAAQTTPLEIILDTLIGTKDMPRVGESPDDDEQRDMFSLSLDTDFTSPYKEYYFGKNAFENNASSYIHFLSSLRVFMQALRDYKEGEEAIDDEVVSANVTRGIRRAGGSIICLVGIRGGII